MRIGTLFGIEITVHVSWIFIFALVAWVLSNPVGPLQLTETNATVRAMLGIAGSLLFFGSVLAHELAHSLLARTRGVTVRGITLFVFGGVSVFEGDPDDAPGEAWISGIGPLTSLIIGGLFWGLAALTPVAAIAALLRYLSVANVMLAAFNILPAYPLDGGRVLHALIWRATGSRVRATSIASAVGGAIAALLIALGIFDALLFDFGGGLWVTFIGWFLLQAGNAERSGAAMARALQGHSAAELATPTELGIGADASAKRALTMMQQAQLSVVPVVLGERIIGVLELDELAGRPSDELERTPVTAFMKRSQALSTVPATTPAGDALTLLVRGRAGVLGLTGPGGDVTGVFTSESVMRWLAGLHPVEEALPLPPEEARDRPSTHM
jgi:Zn-dependent protease/CBS domain-containing protein